MTKTQIGIGIFLLTYAVFAHYEFWFLPRYRFAYDRYIEPDNESFINDIEGTGLVAACFLLPNLVFLIWFIVLRYKTAQLEIGRWWIKAQYGVMCIVLIFNILGSIILLSEEIHTQLILDPRIEEEAEKERAYFRDNKTPFTEDDVKRAVNQGKYYYPEPTQ